MDSVTNFRSTSSDPQTLLGGASDNADLEDNQATNPLDSDKNKKLHAQLMDWLDQELQRQGANRYQMALDEDYYDSLQWTEDDAQELLDRGQAPLVFNEIKPTIDWMIGTERRTRIDGKVLPRRQESNDDALLKTDLLKYLSDTNKTPFHRSRAFDDATKAGLGWIETGVRGDEDNLPLYTRYQDWRQMIYDSNGVELDCSDWRYVFRWKWLDMDIATAYFPDRADVLKSEGTIDKQPLQEQDDLWYLGSRVTQPGSDYASVGKYTPYSAAPFSTNRRPRTKVYEAWYRVPVLKRYFSGGQLRDVEFDSQNPEHIQALKGQWSLYDKLAMQINCAVFCAGGLLYVGESPYKHGRFPFIPVWCYRRKRDNAPYGIIRALRDPQDDLNKRASKALWILSSNRVIMDQGAVEDIEALREEVSRADAIIEKKKGSDFQLNRDIELADSHLNLIQRDIAHIRNVGGVNDENLGRETNAHSGVAIQSRQEQGSVVTTEPFDNLRLAVQMIGEMELSNIENFMSEPMQVRIVGDRGNAMFKSVNQIQPDGSVLNDVTKEQADYVVSEQDYRSTLRQAMFESMFDLVGKLGQVNPQVALNLLDLVVEMVDVPNRDELVARIRKINGQSDPTHTPTPQEIQQQQQQEQVQNAQQELALRTAQTELAKLDAEKDNLEAEAVMKRVEAIYAALQAAGVVAQSPAAAAIADHVMQEVGFDGPAVQQDMNSIQQGAPNLQPPAVAPQPPQQPSTDQPPNEDVSPPPIDMPTGMQGVEHGIETARNDGTQTAQQ